MPYWQPHLTILGPRGRERSQSASINEDHGPVAVRAGTGGEVQDLSSHILLVSHPTHRYDFCAYVYPAGAVDGMARLVNDRTRHIAWENW